MIQDTKANFQRAYRSILGFVFLFFVVNPVFVHAEYVKVYDLQTNFNQSLIQNYWVCNDASSTRPSGADYWGTYKRGSYGSGCPAPVSGDRYLRYWLNDYSNKVSINTEDAFYLLQYNTASCHANIKYKNQIGTQRTMVSSSHKYPIIINGQNHCLTKIDFNGSDTQYYDLEINTQARYIFFGVVTDDDLYSLITDENSFNNYMSNYLLENTLMELNFNVSGIGYIYPSNGSIVYGTTTPITMRYNNQDGEYVSAVFYLNNKDGSESTRITSINLDSGYNTATIPFTWFLPYYDMLNDTAYDLRVVFVGSSKDIGTKQMEFLTFKISSVKGGTMADLGEMIKVILGVDNQLTESVCSDFDSFNNVINCSKNIIGYIFPFGYFYDIYDLFATTSTSTMPILSFTLPASMKLGTPSLELDTYKSLDWILYATSSHLAGTESENETFYDITSYYFDKIIWLMFFIYIVLRLLNVPFYEFVDGGDGISTFKTRQLINKGDQQGVEIN